MTTSPDKAPSGAVVALQCFPVKSMGGVAAPGLDVAAHGVVGDRDWAVYDAAGKLASGKHTRRFRRMDPVFALVARREGGDVVVTRPDGTELVAGHPATDEVLSAHFGEPVRLGRDDGVRHQDAAAVSLVGTATLAELGRYEGDGRVLDPRHLRANLVVETDEPYAEDTWVGHEVTVGGVRLRVTGRTQRCRMVGVAQVGLAARADMLRVVSEQHGLMAGVYAQVVEPGRVALGDEVAPS
ncbi:MOSC domain-containing protein [Pedococcus sp. 2YAF34]|uniref:MOSC domain-containing protein n=1 Tax=Pedococcus sp. 2YAF34 TaxID=3233032 RepID=UPI003F9EAD48